MSEHCVVTRPAREVIEAIGIQPGLFQSWVVRQFVQTAHKPGTGRARQFTLLEAVRALAVHQLVQFHFEVSLASRLSMLISDDDLDLDRSKVLLWSPPDTAVIVPARDFERHVPGLAGFLVLPLKGVIQPMLALFSEETQ